MFTSEQKRLHRSIARAKRDPEWRAMRKAVDERNRKAMALLERIKKELSPDLTGVVMVNADTEEWFQAANKDAGWKEARRRYGPQIAHPPLWMINIDQPTPKDVLSPR